MNCKNAEESIYGPLTPGISLRVKGNPFSVFIFSLRGYSFVCRKSIGKRSIRLDPQMIMFHLIDGQNGLPEVLVDLIIRRLLSWWMMDPYSLWYLPAITSTRSPRNNSVANVVIVMQLWMKSCETVNYVAQLRSIMNLTISRSVYSHLQNWWSSRRLYHLWQR